MQFIWHEVLFRPLLNLLIGLYNTIGGQNLGWSIVYLTILIRILLFPLSLKDRRGRVKEDEVRLELQRLQKMFGSNPSVLREEQRKLFSRVRFRRWPKVLSLAIQGLVLVILYQVFLGGINVAKIVDQLYPWIHVPVTINTRFLYFFDVAERGFVLSFLCGLLLFATIWLGYKKIGKVIKRQDLLYTFGFPAVTFAVLWYLPSVKAVFILVSMLFSSAISAITAFRASVKEQTTTMSDRLKDEEKQRQEGLPGVRERF